MPETAKSEEAARTQPPLRGVSEDRRKDIPLKVLGQGWKSRLCRRTQPDDAHAETLQQQRTPRFDFEHDRRTI
jgi:hypothetical protein